MSRHLFIVSRETPHLADYMREQFAGDPAVEVFVDRRGGRDRRTGSLDIVGERRDGCNRRHRVDIPQELQHNFHALVAIATAP